MDAILLSLPNNNIDYPALSLPTLSATLKQRGYSVEQREANVELRDQLLTQESLAELTHCVLPFLCRENLNDSRMYERLLQNLRLLRYIEDRWEGFEHIETTKRLLQQRRLTEVFTDGERFDATMAIFKLSRLLHQLFDIYVTRPSVFEECGARDPITPKVNALIEEINRRDPVVAGFTVLETQRPFSMWFAQRLREEYSGVIAIGGADPTRFRESYLKHYPFVDYVFVKEGEESFPRFLSLLKGSNDDIRDVPGLVYRSGDEIVCNETEDIDPAAVPTPDFEGFALDKFLLPALPVQASRGCHWQRCKFCIHWRTYSRYYSRPVSRVVDDLEILSRLHNTCLFHFTDDDLSVELGNSICEEILRRDLKLTWLTYARLEPRFTRGVLEKWNRAGCAVIEWGLESGCQRILNAMDKGIKVTVAQRVLDDAAAVGILSKVFGFHNYPGETSDSLDETLQFLRNNILARKVRPFLAIRNKLFLLKGSILFDEVTGPEGHKLFRKVWVPSGDFAIEGAYEDLDRSYPQRRAQVEDFLSEMQAYINDNEIFTTDDDNVTMDLAIIHLKKQGVRVARDNI